MVVALVSYPAVIALGCACSRGSHVLVAFITCEGPVIFCDRGKVAEFTEMQT